MLEFLPPRLSAALRHVNLNLLYELRVRADKPLVANLGGTFCYVGGKRSNDAARSGTCPYGERTLGHCVCGKRIFRVFRLRADQTGIFDGCGGGADRNRGGVMYAKAIACCQCIRSHRSAFVSRTQSLVVRSGFIPTAFQTEFVRCC